MPLRLFAYPCCSAMSSSITCATHGRDGWFHHWSLTMHESMFRFMKVYGIAAIGPQRSLVNQHLMPLRRTCDTCSGYGLLGGALDPRPSFCPECHGTGGHWTAPEEEVRRKREYVLAIFPKARVRQEGRAIGPEKGLWVVI